MWMNASLMERQWEAFKARTHNLSEADRNEAWKAQLEQQWNEIERCVCNFVAGPNVLQGGQFDTLSLGTWYEIIQACNIKAVPIVFAGMFEGPFTKELFESENPKLLLDFSRVPQEWRNFAAMVRLDVVGTELLKKAFSFRGREDFKTEVIGAYFEENQWYFKFDDRTLNGLLNYVGQLVQPGNIQCPIWWRPWVNALQARSSRPAYMGRSAPVDTWPIEWRAYIQGGELTAISAYYIQTPVVLTPQLEEHLRSIVTSVKQMLSYMKQHSIQPWHPRYIGDHNSDDVSFSCDFISAESGPLWLEAGPAVPVDDSNIPVFEPGAHPCYFVGRPVKGVALDRNSKPLPLRQFE